jgi:hypothetical protein
MTLSSNTFINCGSNSSNVFYFTPSAVHDGANHVVFNVDSSSGDALIPNGVIVPSALGALYASSCSEVASWAGYVCLPPSSGAAPLLRFVPLHVYNRDAETAVGPMTVASDDGTRDVINGANIRFFPNLAVGRKYTLEFAKRTPLQLELHLKQTATADDAVVISIKYDSLVSAFAVHVATHHWGDWYDEELPMGDEEPTLNSTHGTWKYDYAAQLLRVTIRHDVEYQAKVKVVATLAETALLGNQSDCATNGSSAFMLPWSLPSTWATAHTSPQRMPLVNDDVTIHCGYSLLLDLSPPDLRHVLLLGSLTFARLDLSFSAHSIRVLRGGVLAVGTESEPFEQQARIRLLGDRFSVVPVFGAMVLAVAEGGQLQLHGSTAGARWTKLSANAYSGDLLLRVPAASSDGAGEDGEDGFGLSTSAVAAWLHGSVVVAPSGFDSAEAELVRVVAVSTVGGYHQLELEQPLAHYHNGHAHHIQESRHDNRAEVALLTRRIVIEAAGDLGGTSGSSSSSDDASVPFGCKIVVTNASSAIVSGVEISGCGQEQRGAAVTFDTGANAQQEAVATSKAAASSSFQIVSSSIHNIHDHGLLIRGDAHRVNAASNVFYSSVGSAVVVESGAHILHRNLAIGAGGDPRRVYLFNTRETPTFELRTLRMNLTANVAAGGSGSGFLFVLGRVQWWNVRNGLTAAETLELHKSAGGLLDETIDETSAASAGGSTIEWVFESNSAHSCSSGVRFVGWAGHDTPSITMYAWELYKNRQYGLQLWQTSATLHLDSAVLADNVEAGVQGKLWYPAKALFITHSTFVGISGQGLRDAASWADAFAAGSGGSKVPAGVISSEFLGGTEWIGGALLPRPLLSHGSSAYNQLSHSGYSLVSDCTFVNYTTTGWTREIVDGQWANGQQLFASAIANQASGDGGHTFETRRLTMVNARPVWMRDPDCQSHDDGSTAVTTLMLPSGCDTATQNIILDDGSLTSAGAPGTIIPNNSALVFSQSTGAGNMCTPAPEWNGFRCEGWQFVGSLMIESLDEDAFIRYMGPLSFIVHTAAGADSSAEDGEYDAARTNVVYGRQDDSGMHQQTASIFMATVAANRTYDLRFGGTVPAHLMLSMRGDVHAARAAHPAPTYSVKLTIPYTRPARLRVFKNGAELPAAQDCTTGELTLTMTGGAVYEIETSGEKADSCYCCSSELKTLLRVQLSLRGSITDTGEPQTLERRRFEHNFKVDVGAVLGVSPQRIDVVSLTAGSIQVEFLVLAATSDSSLNATTGSSEYEAQSLSTLLESAISNSTSGLYHGHVTNGVEDASYTSIELMPVVVANGSSTGAADGGSSTGANCDILQCQPLKGGCLDALASTRGLAARKAAICSSEQCAALYSCLDEVRAACAAGRDWAGLAGLRQFCESSDAAVEQMASQPGCQSTTSCSSG